MCMCIVTINWLLRAFQRRNLGIQLVGIRCWVFSKCMQFFLYRHCIIQLWTNICKWGCFYWLLMLNSWALEDICPYLYAMVVLSYFLPTSMYKCTDECRYRIKSSTLGTFFTFPPQENKEKRPYTQQTQFAKKKKKKNTTYWIAWRAS